MIFCGHCQEAHETVEQVRNCSRYDPISEEGVHEDGPAFAVQQQRSRKTGQDALNDVFGFRTPSADAERADEEGYYHKDGETYRLIRSKSSGFLYAKRLIENDEGIDWIYDPGAAKTTLKTEKLTKEQAGQYGRRTGHCLICGTKLTNPTSVEAGIGPICGGRLV